MSPNPRSFLQHLKDEGYHSRSNKHSNALASEIAVDLVEHCPSMAERAASGRLVYDLNFTLRVATTDWNVDLVLGRPALGEGAGAGESPIRRAKPATVQVAIEIKSVMTEHRKAIKNRKRDLEAHHDHVHHYNNQAIAGGVLVINSAARFRSPLRAQVTMHSDPAKLVRHCLSELRAVTMRGGITGSGLEAKCALVVEMDNEDLPTTRYLTKAPAPTVGDPLHYDAFVQTICEHYRLRF